MPKGLTGPGRIDPQMTESSSLRRTRLSAQKLALAPLSSSESFIVAMGQLAMMFVQHAVGGCVTVLR